MQRQTMRRPKCQQGLAMVEFTLVLPLLLLLLLALGEFGRMLYQYNSLLQASRDAVRYVASEAWNATLGKVDVSADLTTATKYVAVYGVPPCPAKPLVPCPTVTPKAVVSGLTTDKVVVSPVGSDHVQVTINYTFCPVIGGGACSGTIPGFFGSSIALSIPLVATTVMRAL